MLNPQNRGFRDLANKLADVKTKRSIMERWQSIARDLSVLCQDNGILRSDMTIAEAIEVLRTSEAQ